MGFILVLIVISPGQLITIRGTESQDTRYNFRFREYTEMVSASMKSGCHCQSCVSCLK